ncbi:hypothetical protein [Dendrosporobacter sp. 1207_IL3150]|uniref:hypothetical protein n=1 Tax=Dendrosporobacter sp. 1207_IL3150 TaxID=3084054 RepID=UPI002FD99873
MNCDNINKLIIFVITLTIVTDLLALFAEFFSQRCERKAEKEQQRKEKKLNDEIENLRNRIVVLEKKIGTQ